MDDYIMHDGRPHDGNIPHSGRYEWGSGEKLELKDDYIMSEPFLEEVKRLREKGIIDEVKLAKELGLKGKGGLPSSKAFREELAVANARKKAYDISYAVRLNKHGYSNTQIAEKMGLGKSGESTVRNLLNPEKQRRALRIQTAADALKEDLKVTGYIDVTKGTEKYLGTTRTTMQQALRMLKDEGYPINYLKVKQMGGSGKFTTTVVLGEKIKEGTGYKEALQASRENKVLIPTEKEITSDGVAYISKHDPVSIDSKKVYVRYADEGGKAKDGVIELRRGVDELDMGNNRYSQVRIAVDDKYYMKGMAIYANDVPKGYDVIYNTKYTKDECIGIAKKDLGIDDASYGSVVGSMKKMKKNKYSVDDPTACLGSFISRQNDIVKTDKDGRTVLDKNGNAVILKKGALNIINEELGDHSWEHYDKNLASQFLSKQTPQLAKQQLKMTLDDKKDQLDTIRKLTNPVIKQYYLNDFADECESDAVTLKASALPRQSTCVILPVPSLKENEVYAPRYEDGEEVALVRYPHGGIFEIPVLKVNNRNKEGRSVIGNESVSVIGIHPKAAQQLSGADFDGDTAIVIPTKNVKLKTAAQLEGLKDFDTCSTEYQAYEGMKVISSIQKQREMGVVSNLITDMTLKGAPAEDVVRATRHSMVIIDAEKHKLNYRYSEHKENIKQLKDKYQNNGIGKKGQILNGASTIISRAKSETTHPERYETVNKETGEIEYKPKIVKLKTVDTIKEKVFNEDTGKYETKSRKVYNWVYDKDGNIKMGPSDKPIKSTKMAEAKDAYELTSGYITLPNGKKQALIPMEGIYADYANELKNMAKEARKESVNLNLPKESPSAKKVYAKEVASLTAKLDTAYKNKPLERRAQMLANQIYRQKEQSSPEGIDKSDVKKIQNICLNIARIKVGANGKDSRVDVTPKEWEAIQNNAISSTKLRDILSNTNKDTLRDYAMPKISKIMTASKISRAKSMLNNDYTMEEVADRLGISISTLSKAINQ